MRIIILLTFALLIWLLFTLGCNNTDEVILGPETQNINSAINLTSIENLDPNASTFEFLCLTDSLYNCANFNIDFVLEVSTDTVDLTFTEISSPTLCLPAPGKAYAIVNLGALAKNNFQFPITINNITVPAQLMVTDSTIEIIGGNSTWTNFLRPVLRRIPANTIWGQVGYNQASDFDSANTFFNSLKSIGAVPETFSTGSYGYFYINGASNPDSILDLGPWIPRNFLIPYVYHYTGDTATLHSLITAYANQGNVVEVNVITSQGFEYRSW